MDATVQLSPSDNFSTCVLRLALRLGPGMFATQERNGRCTPDCLWVRELYNFVCVQHGTFHQCGFDRCNSLVWHINEERDTCEVTGLECMGRTAQTYEEEQNRNYVNHHLCSAKKRKVVSKSISSSNDSVRCSDQIFNKLADVLVTGVGVSNVQQLPVGVFRLITTVAYDTWDLITTPVSGAEQITTSLDDHCFSVACVMGAKGSSAKAFSFDGRQRILIPVISALSRGKRPFNRQKFEQKCVRRYTAHETQIRRIMTVLMKAKPNAVRECFRKVDAAIEKYKCAVAGK